MQHLEAVADGAEEEMELEEEEKVARSSRHREEVEQEGERSEEGRKEEERREEGEEDPPIDLTSVTAAEPSFDEVTEGGQMGVGIVDAAMQRLGERYGQQHFFVDTGDYARTEEKALREHGNCRIFLPSRGAWALGAGDSELQWSGGKRLGAELNSRPRKKQIMKDATDWVRS